MPPFGLRRPPACAASFSSNSRGASPFLHGHAGRSFFRQFPSPAAPPGRSPRPMPFAPITTVPSQVSLSRSRQSPRNALFSLPAYHAPPLLSPAFRHPAKFSTSKLPATCCTPHLPPPTSTPSACSSPRRQPRCCWSVPPSRALPLPVHSVLAARPTHPPPLFPPPTALLFHSALLAAYASSARPSLTLYVRARLPEAARCAQPPESPPKTSCPISPAMPFASAPFLPSPFSLVFSRGKEHSPARAPC